MNLYEFTLVAQQDLLQQEVEEIVQELGVLLKNIKADLVLQQIEDVLKEKEIEKFSKQQLETQDKSIRESLVNYSNFLEGFVKIFWTELEKDLSNLKEVESKVSEELKNVLKSLGMAQGLIKLPENGKQIAKSVFIRNTINSLKRKVLEYLMKTFQESLTTSSKLIDQNHRLGKVLEALLGNIEASGLVKYEYWGLLNFAYPIGNAKSGHYCMMCISSTSSIMNEFVRRVKLNENVIRYLPIRVDKFFEGKSYMMNEQIERQGT